MSRVAIVAAMLLFAGLSPARSAGYDVDVVEFRFDPETIEVDPGDQITWTNLDSIEHTVTSDAGLWDSGLMAQGETFTVTLNSPGTYRYICIPHSIMEGFVVVRGSGGPPGMPASVEATPSLVPGYATVRWTQPDDDGGSPVQRYNVCKGTTSGNLDQCATVVGTTYIDGGNMPATPVFYTVAAVNSFGTGPPSAETCAIAGPWLTAVDC